MVTVQNLQYTYCKSRPFLGRMRNFILLKKKFYSLQVINTLRRFSCSGRVLHSEINASRETSNTYGDFKTAGAEGVRSIRAFIVL
jgi:hypothetical protein